MKSANQLPAVSRIQSARFIHHLTALLVFALGAFAVPASYAQVESVKAAPLSGFYNAGDTVSIVVTFSEEVTVSGDSGSRVRMRFLTNTAAGTSPSVNYSGPGTTTLMTFTYTVQTGDDTRDLAYVSRTSLSLFNGATITTVSSNEAATLTLPEPGQAGSLSATSAVVLDNTAPEFPDAADSSDPLVLTIGTGSTTATTVYNAQATDYAGTADTGITYTLGGTAADVAPFSLDTNTGVLTPKASPTAAGTYTLTITATDQAGNVGTQHLSVAVLPPTAPTAAPTNVMLLPSDGEILVSWTPVDDADNGGSDITSYTATAIGGAKTFTCSPHIAFGNACLITDLTNDTQYIVTVVANNGEEGNAPSSVEVTATPRAAPDNTPPTAQTVPADFALTPDGFAAGDSFRLLFVTTATTTAESSHISLYNDFVQTSAAGGHSAILDFKSEFRALISTGTVDANVNTDTTGTGVPIYWLNGDKVADNYTDFYDGSWASVAGTDESGGTRVSTTDSLRVWTGSNANGTKYLLDRDRFAGNADAGTDGAIRVRRGNLDLDGTKPEINAGNDLSTVTRPLYALSPVLTVNAATARLNEQILTRASQAMTASTMAAVAARVDAAAGGAGATPTVAYQLGGQSSLRGLLESHGKAMLEGEMEYERLLDGASLVLPLAAADSDSAATAGAMAFWVGSDNRTLESNEDNLDWDGNVLAVHLGIDRQLSQQMMAGVALSWNQSGFDYQDELDGSSGEYRYNSVNLHPYFGWYPSDELKLWGTLGYGQGEIEIETDEVQATDSAQLSLSGGFSKWLLNSTELLPGGATTLNLKGDVSLTSVDVEEKADFAAQEVGSTRLRVLVSGEQQRGLASGGRLMPSLEVGVRYDGGDGVTGAGVELGGGLRYANPGGDLSVAGNVRTLLAGGYDELGVDVTVRLAPQSGRGLSLSLRPVWGKTGSAAERLWNDGASEITGGDTALVGSVDTEVGYGVAATMLGSPGVLTPYTGMTAQDGGSSRLRLGGRFVGGNGLSLNLEGVRGNTADGASHQVLLRGEVSF